MHRLPPLSDAAEAPEWVTQLLRLLAEHGASDLHMEPASDRVQLRWRRDGVLEPCGQLPLALGPNVVGRLKVLAGLLTYETALPQEGRIRAASEDHEFRVSTFPTLFGEKVVIRVLGQAGGELELVEQLGLAPAVHDCLTQDLRSTSGAVVIAGPAGSGKTTTAYAALREILAQASGGRSVASLEDPVEVVVPGVAQTQVNESAGLTMATGLRSLLRQDPEVIFIGEIRDRAVADVALQAALTGQLVVTTFHAGNCAEVLHRLGDMGLPAYAVQNAVRLIVAQRLLRHLCDCAAEADPATDAAPLGFDVDACRVASGCDACRQTGYQGRQLIAEAYDVPAGRLLTRPLWTEAEQLVRAGLTSPLEAARVLGWRNPRSPAE